MGANESGGAPDRGPPSGKSRVVINPIQTRLADWLHASVADVYDAHLRDSPRASGLIQKRQRPTLITNRRLNHSARSRGMISVSSAASHRPGLTSSPRKTGWSAFDVAIEGIQSLSSNGPSVSVASIGCRRLGNIEVLATITRSMGGRCNGQGKQPSSRDKLPML